MEGSAVVRATDQVVPDSGAGCVVPTPEKINILDFDPERLSQELTESLGLRSFRSQQLIRWLYKKRVRSFDMMTDISLSVREALAERFTISRLDVEAIQHSNDGTKKFLFRLSDGSAIESVLIKQPQRYTLCISSQVGCAIGCRFCRTAQMGLKRNLKTAEIIGQVLTVQDEIERLGMPETFSNIVFMGMGEPFHNIKNVISAVKLLNERGGLDFSARKITVSTSGLVPAIEKFGKSGAQANLAISLNATTDEIRDQVMPINKRWPISALLDALRAYPLKKGRRITIEYVMLRDVNDTVEDFRRLQELVRDIPAKINLIPYNDNSGLGFLPPPRDRVFFWQKKLLERGFNSTIRWSKGRDIDAACGQLAANNTKVN